MPGQVERKAMHSNTAFDTSGAVTVEGGEVMIDGPNGIALSLTPRAAREMGRRLIAAADRAVERAGSAGDEGDLTG